LSGPLSNALEDEEENATLQTMSRTNSKSFDGRKSQGHPAGHVTGSDAKPKEYYYSVMWCKFSKKKHKKWEGDAFLITCGRSVTLKDTEGKDIGKGTGYKASALAGLDEGHTLVIGGKEIEVMNRISSEQWESGKCFLGSAPEQPSALLPQPVHRQRLKKGFRNPVEPGAKEKPELLPVKPYHDPLAKGALLMPQPSLAHQWENNPSCLPVVDVVVDPLISKHLRPHQREGIVFLYECVLGMRDYNGLGCILA
jgi:DNA repair and recombination protein RAD54B